MSVPKSARLWKTSSKLVKESRLQSMLESKRAASRTVLEREEKRRSLLRGKALLEVMAVLLRSLLDEMLPVMTRRRMNTLLST
jgi:hypothetical protein